MNKLLLTVILLVVLAGTFPGCAPAAIPPAPTHAAFSLPTLIPPTQIPVTPTAVATVPPLSATPTSIGIPAAPTVEATLATTAIASPTVTAPMAGPSPAVSPTASPSPTARAFATPTAAPSPTAAIAPGIYVTDLRLDPPPVRGSDLTFFVTFLNSMGGDQNYRWGVFIFKAETQRQFSETGKSKAAIPAGQSEQQSEGSWRLQLGGPCDYFYAQVGWVNPENKIIWFTSPSGSLFQKAFTVCPP